jgi:CBS domain-containing protein
MLVAEGEAQMVPPPVRLDAPPESLDEDPPVSVLMSQRLIGISPDADATVALRLLAAAGVRHLPVLSGDRCVGVVFEHDVVNCVARLGGISAAAAVSVGELCRPVPFLRPEQPRSAAAARMRDSGIDAVLVTARDRLVGVVTASDLIRSLADEHRAGAASQTGP